MTSRSKKTFIALMVTTLAASVNVASPVGATTQDRAYIDRPILRAEGMTSALVHVRAKVPLLKGVKAAREAGLQIGTRYDVINVFVAYGTADQFRQLAQFEAIEALEANRRIKTFTDTSHKATRGQNLLDGEVTLADGTIIDGSGIGVAVVDSGVDGTHPDLDDRMGGNVKIICTTPQPVVTSATGGFTECLGPKVAVPVPDSDHPSGGGHGTHVAGTISGTGEASDGTWHGAAPGATLYGVSVGTVLLVENALDGLAWVLANHDQVTPAIRVVNNSWGSSYSKYDPQNAPFHKATWKLQEALVAAGVTVVFAAGNSGGNGSAPTTSAECINPTPGIICVANYDDKNTGTRAGSIDSSSSRGKTDDPTSWPDLAAPGTEITATCRLTLPVCNAHFGPEFDPPNHYATLSGTSMAAPHVSGIVAQVLQTNPQLSPADVENLLEDTALKFAWGSPYGVHSDPFNPDDTSSFEKGHGLVDVTAAVKTLLGTPEPEPTDTGSAEPSPTTVEPQESRFFFHTGVLVNSVDKFFGTASFDENQPQLCCGFHGIAIDTPLGGTNGQTIWDATWTGNVSHSIRRLTIDFWDGATEDEAQRSGKAAYNVAIWQGTKRTLLPQISVEGAGGTGRLHVTHTYSTMLAPDGPDEGTAPDEVPLDIDPAGNPISIEIDNAFLNDASAILFDAVEVPSGFTAYSTVMDATSSPTDPPEAAVTSLEFTQTATGGQYSDEASLSAVLTNEDTGEPIPNKEIEFKLFDEEVSKSWTVTTNDDGVANQTISLDVLPNQYELTARFEGEPGAYEASGDFRTFVVEQEDTALVVTKTGKGSKSQLEARLADLDSDIGIGGRAIDFYTDGVSMGTADTNEQGVAVFDLPARYQEAHHEYLVVFDGDDYYLRSEDREQT